MCGAGVWCGQCLNPDHRMPPGAVRDGEPLGPLRQIAIEEGICLTHISGGCYENGACEEMQDWSGANGPRARGQAYRGAVAGGHEQGMITGGGSGGYHQRRRCGAAYQVNEEDEDEMEKPATTMGRRRHRNDCGEPTRSRYGAGGYEDEEEAEMDDPITTSERRPPQGFRGGGDRSRQGAGGYGEEEEEEEEDKMDYSTIKMRRRPKGGHGGATRSRHGARGHEEEEEDRTDDPTAITMRRRPQGSRWGANPSRRGTGKHTDDEIEDEMDEAAAPAGIYRLQGDHGAAVNDSDHDSGPPTGGRRIDEGVSRALTSYRNGAEDMMGQDEETETL
ncbi:MAG: hypothetical protein Q9223_007404 [Gallowayella weberi]